MQWHQGQQHVLSARDDRGRLIVSGRVFVWKEQLFVACASLRFYRKSLGCAAHQVYAQW